MYMFQFSQTKINSVQIKNKLAEDIVTTNICMRTSNSKYTVSCYTSFFNKQEERELKVTQFGFEDTKKKIPQFFLQVGVVIQSKTQVQTK